MSPKKDNKIDIFPNVPVGHVSRLLEYPNFSSLVVDSYEDIKCFCLFMDRDDKIHFEMNKLTMKLSNSLPLFGKVAKTRNDFKPDAIKWNVVLNKFRRPTDAEYRTNADTRTGFKIGNCYLVRTHFTFGQRTVEEKTNHLIQTLHVPLLFYLRPKHLAETVVKIEKRHFPSNKLKYYDRRVLEPNTAYRIPAGVTYFIFTTQKNYFSVNVIPESLKLEFKTTDPVLHRVTVKKLMMMMRKQDPYQDPAETPYIDEKERTDFYGEYFEAPPPPQQDDDDENLMPPPPSLPSSQPIYNNLNEMSCFQQQQQDVSAETTFLQMLNEPLNTFHHQQQQQQQEAAVFVENQSFNTNNFQQQEEAAVFVQMETQPLDNNFIHQETTNAAAATTFFQMEPLNNNNFHHQETVAAAFPIQNQSLNNNNFHHQEYAAAAAAATTTTTFQMEAQHPESIETFPVKYINNFQTTSPRDIQMETLEQQQQQQQQQDVMYYMLPPPPILERKIYVTNADFIKSYHILKQKIMEDPLKGWVPPPPSSEEENKEKPIDLTFNNIELTIDMDKIFNNVVDQNEIDEICNTYLLDSSPLSKEIIVDENVISVV